MVPYEIYFAAVPWKGCLDQRPWVIVDLRPNDLFGCFPISGQSYGDNCFEIPSSHPDFPKTGLTKTCRVHYTSIFELHRSELLRLKGSLTGDLLTQFLTAAGLP